MHRENFIYLINNVMIRVVKLIVPQSIIINNMVTRIKKSRIVDMRRFARVGRRGKQVLLHCVA